MLKTHHIIPVFLLYISVINVLSETYRFDFGSGETAVDFTQVLPNQSYSESAGFGFESNSGTVQSVSRSSGDALFQDFITGNSEIFFSVKVPQGNYDLTVYLGDPDGGSITTVQAENQRLLFDRISTSSGQSAEATITVNNRETTSLDGSVTMSIKDRELGYYTWDNKLTLRFSGSSPAVSGIVLETNDTARTLFLCGNSTVVDQLTPGWASWGQMIPRFLAPGVVVANYAESGLTAPAFLSMRRLDKLLADSKPGDYVFVEFGHNDQKNSTDANNYPNNLETFYNQITAKGANPIFVTPTARDGDRDTLTSIAGLAEKMRIKAAELGVPLIDLNSMTMQIVAAIGSANATTYMYNDVSHFKPYGAYELANCVANALLNMQTNFHSKILDAAEFDPSHPHPVDYLTNDQYVTVPISQQYSLVPTKNLHGFLSNDQIIYWDGGKAFSISGRETMRIEP